MPGTRSNRFAVAMPWYGVGAQVSTFNGWWRHRSKEDSAVGGAQTWAACRLSLHATSLDEPMVSPLRWQRPILYRLRDRCHRRRL